MGELKQGAILKELRQVTQNNRIQLRDIAEWYAIKVKPCRGDVEFYLPKLQLYVYVKMAAKHK